MNNTEKQTEILKDALKKLMDEEKIGELSDDALGEVAGGAVLEGWKFSVARCKKCGWVSALMTTGVNTTSPYSRRITIITARIARAILKRSPTT